MDRGTGDDGNISDLPWTAVFDPVANARALSAIQAEGFRAAARLVDRFVSIAETNGNGAEPAAADETAASNSGPDADLIVSSWWSLWGRLLRSMPGVSGSSAPATFELTADNENGPVHLQADGAGCVETEIWLHNSGTADLPDVRLLCGELLSHEGHVIPSDAVRFTPECVPMPSRSSRGIGMEVTVAEGLPPGRYRGTVLAGGYPDLWMPVIMSVRASAE